MEHIVYCLTGLIAGGFVADVPFDELKPIFAKPFGKGQILFFAGLKIV